MGKKYPETFKEDGRNLEEEFFFFERQFEGKKELRIPKKAGRGGIKEAFEATSEMPIYVKIFCTYYLIGVVMA